MPPILAPQTASHRKSLDALLDQLHRLDAARAEELIAEISTQVEDIINEDYPTEETYGDESDEQADSDDGVTDDNWAAGTLDCEP